MLRTCRHIARQLRASIFMAAAAVISVFIPTGCATPSTPTFEGAIYSFEDFALFPDSLFIGGTALFLPDSSAIPDPFSYGPHMEGSDRLINAIFNSADPTALLNDVSGEKTAPAPKDSALTAYRLYLYDALCRPDTARAVIERWISHKDFSEAGSLRWPVLSATIGWALPAREIWRIDADEQWHDRCIDELMTTLRRDRYLTFDRQLNLFRGATGTIVKFRSTPTMNTADIAAIYSFSANIDRIVAYDFIATMRPHAAALRDSLSKAVETGFWLPDRGFFSEMLYQWPFPIQLSACDNLAQGMAIASGSISEAAASALVRNTPMLRRAFGPFYPEPAVGNISPERQAVAASLWSIGAARVRNSRAFGYAYAMLTLAAVTTPGITDIFRGATIRGLFGINPEDSCLTVSPFIPEEFGNTHTLRNFPYRDATIDLTVVGKGDVISTVMIDDEVVDVPRFPSSLTGHHTMRITLSGLSSTISGMKFTENVILPDAEEPHFDAENVKLSRFDEFEVYRNGELLEIIDSDRYRLSPTDEPTFYTFVPVIDDSIAGIAATSVMRHKSRGIIREKATSIARTGTRLFNHRNTDKTLGKQFVESSRYRNPKLRFTVNSHAEGTYYLQLVYLKGLGIVNPGRHYALRSLTVNDEYSGLLVLPQLTPADWKPDTKWWEFRGESFPIPIKLHSGVNTISVDWFAPEAAGFTDDSNTIIPTEIRLIPR